MVITTVNIVAVFVYQWYVLISLGAGSQSDALFASMVLPQLILNVISGSLSFVLVPMLATVADRDFDKLVASFLLAFGMVFAFVALVFFFTAHYWVPLTVPGFSIPLRANTVVLVQIQLIGMVFTGAGAVTTAAYQARHRFAFPASAGSCASLIALAFLLIALPRYGVRAAAWGLSLRAFLHFCFQLPIALPPTRPDFRDSKFRGGLAKLTPLVLGTTYYKTDQLVDRLLVSMAPVGTLSLLHLSQQVYAAASQVFGTAIVAPTIPIQAANAGRGDYLEFRRKLMLTLKILLLLGILVFAAIVFPGYYALKLIFGHGMFNVSEIRDLWLIMIALGAYWISGLSGQILAVSFYGMSDTRTPTKVGAIGFTLGIGLKIGGFFTLGVWGIAIGSGLYNIFNSVVMFWILNRRLKLRLE